MSDLKSMESQLSLEKIIKKSFSDQFSIESANGSSKSTEYQDIGVLLLLQRHGLVIVDVPVNMRPRAMGGSRIFYNWSVVAYYMTHTLVLSACKRIGLSPYQRPAVAPKVFL